MTRSFLAWAALALTAGCYAPTPDAGSACATAPCPTGLVCSPATQTCELVAVDAAPIDAEPDASPDAPLDAPADARPIDAQVIDAPPPMLRLLRQGSAKSDADVESLALGFTTPTTAGDVLIMIGATPSNSLATVSGGGVSTWTRATKSTTHLNLEIWSGSVVTASTTPVTVALPGSPGPMRLWVGEWSGLAVPVVLDAALATSGETSPATPPPITTNATGRALVIFAVADGAGNTYGQPTGGPWTSLLGVTSASTSQAEWYRVEAGAVTEQPTVSETSHQWDAALAAFRLAE